MTYRVLFLVFIIFVLQVHAIKRVDRDKCNPRCSKFGNCFEEGKNSNGTEEYKCHCHSLYYGDDCTKRWNDDKTWSVVFLIYSITEVIMMLACVAFCVYQLYITIKYATQAGWRKWTIATFTLTLMGAGSLVRAVEFAVDPHAVREILSTLEDELLFSLPLVMWVAGGLSILLYWVELHMMSGIKEVLFVRKLRPVLIILVTVCAVLVVPATVANAVASNPLSLIIYSIALVIPLSMFIIISTVFGLKVRRRIHKIARSSNVEKFQRFLMRITISIYSMAAFATSIIILIIVYNLASGESNKWSYLVLHWIFRIQEFGMICSILFVLNKKLPKSTPGSGSKERSSVSLELKSDSVTESSETKLERDAEP